MSLNDEVEKMLNSIVKESDVDVRFGLSRAITELPKPIKGYLLIVWNLDNTIAGYLLPHNRKLGANLAGVASEFFKEEK